jgi:uncharacterized protein
MSPSRPLMAGVTDLVRHPGSRKPVNRTVRFEHLGISTATVPPDEDVAVDLVLESIANGIVAEGTLTVPWVGDCRRCLREIRGTAVSEMREIFDRHPVEGETYPFTGEVVDLDPMVRDAVLLALPLAPLCGPDCRGPAPEEFPATVEGDEGGSEGADDGAPAGDPRWAALDQLHLD